MKTVKVSGKTIEEALNEALEQLEAANKDEIDYKVIEEPSKGFLGFIGTKPAVLEAWLKPDPIDESIQFLQKVIQDMQVNVDVEVKKRGRETELSLIGEDLGVMIGKRGKTLDSLQYLVNLVANRHSDRYARIVLDAENYRERRQEALEQLAERLAAKAFRTGEKVVLEPMNARERKIIHAALQEKEGVETHSDGKEPRRHVVITPLS
ncbi:RNA-binding cell elongation regulator Jag/EloR [Alteribacillus bidgolensis]|uniref:RNA-binding protein KhpB n=1 Tax=Alteribacillus bidgolensis TaxID=930129 RepID=A0A1G8LQK7_9BACI|nr:RNA-binding cell elongation regulator Jag/EloR [Alteribacillus bidgolensis]SDI57913.1 spoIIIJ-associated protein [Alteribacillus bidgolensis]